MTCNIYFWFWGIQLITFLGLNSFGVMGIFGLRLIRHSLFVYEKSLKSAFKSGFYNTYKITFFSLCVRVMISKRLFEVKNW